MAERPVIAAVVNYNMADELGRLLPELEGHGYDEIFVLDDASTDHSRDVVAALHGNFRFITRDENRGAGSSRNQIIPFLPERAIVHFLDADIVPVSDRMADRARDIFPARLVGFIGGLTLPTEGIQNPWNYGPRQSLRADTGALIQFYLESKYLTEP